MLMKNALQNPGLPSFSAGGCGMRFCTLEVKTNYIAGTLAGSWLCYWAEACRQQVPAGVGCAEWLSPRPCVSPSARDASRARASSFAYFPLVCASLSPFLWTRRPDHSESEAYFMLSDSD